MSQSGLPLTRSVRFGRHLGVALTAIGMLTTAAAAEEVDPAALVDSLEAQSGVHPGFRRAHAKGVCAEGSFQSTGAGSTISKAALLKAGVQAPVVARFSTSGGDPNDSDQRRELRSLALSIPLAGGEEFRSAMNHAPVFAISRPEHFVGLQLSRAPDPKTGKPDPAKVAAFDEAHPDTRPLREWLSAQPLPKSFAHAAYYSAHTFAFTDAAGQIRYAKWEFQPAAGIAGISAEELTTRADDFLFADLRADVARAPLRWTMVLVLAEAGDPLTDPTTIWPAARQRLTVGTLTISKVEPGSGGACRDITFDPLVLPSGIDPSDDPVLLARSAPYAISLSRRLSEKTQ